MIRPIKKTEPEIQKQVEEKEPEKSSLKHRIQTIAKLLREQTDQMTKTRQYSKKTIPTSES